MESLRSWCPVIHRAGEAGPGWGAQSGLWSCQGVPLLMSQRLQPKAFPQERKDVNGCLLLESTSKLGTVPATFLDT